MFFKVISLEIEQLRLRRAESLTKRASISRQVSINSSYSDSQPLGLEITDPIDKKARENAQLAIEATAEYNLMSTKHPNTGYVLISDIVTKKSEGLSVSSALYRSTHKGIHPHNEDHILSEIIQHKPDSHYTVLLLADGHGPDIRDITQERTTSGAKCSQFVCEKTMENLKAQLHDTPDADILHIFKENIHKIETRFTTSLSGKRAGTTYLAVTIKHHNGKMELSSLNVGDSRAILLKQNSHGKLEAECLTVDQDFTHVSPEEWTTIEENGGRFVYYKRNPITQIKEKLTKDSFDGLFDTNGYKLTYIQSGIYNINMSHTLGNHHMKTHTDDTGRSWPISNTPNIYRRDIEPEDQYILLASDGVWSVTTPEDVSRFISSELEQGTDKNELSAKLVNYAYQCGSLDDISVTLYKINQTTSESTPPTSSKSKRKYNPPKDRSPKRTRKSPEKFTGTGSLTRTKTIRHKK